MAVRDSWATQNSGPAGILDVEEARLAIAALVVPHIKNTAAKSGFRPGPTSPGLVTATGTPDAFVHVAPFQLLLQGGRSTNPGVYLACVDATFDVNILSTPADPTNPRNDLIVAQQSDTFYGDGSSPFQIRQIVGTPSGTPADPSVSGSGDYVALARVRVDANATTIVSAKITDLRTSGHAKSLVGGLYSVALGGLLPVASLTEQNALTGVYDGFPTYRSDLKRVFLYDGSAHQPLIGSNERAVRRPFANTNTFNNQTTYAVFPNATDRAALQVSFTKALAGTRLVVSISGMCNFTSGTAQNLFLGIRINGADSDVAHYPFGTATVRNQITGFTEVTGVAAGTFTVEPVFKAGGASAVSFEAGNDLVSFSIAEAF